MSRMGSTPVNDIRKSFKNTIIRQELLADIENSGHNCVLLCSIAGYGKTTLLGQLAARTTDAVVCTLGPGDNDLPYFLDRLGTAIHKLVPQFINDDREYAYAFLERICRVAAENQLLIGFDNCHLIKDQAVCDALQFIMSAAENSFKLVMASRSIPDYTVRFILAKRCHLYGRSELALTENEIAGMLQTDHGPKNLGMARKLTEVTGGWAAGVMFCLPGAADCINGESMDWDRLADRRLIKQYIIYEILSDLPGNVAEFARFTSLLDHLSAEFCDAILDTNDSRECLDYLLENDIFIRECPGEPGSFEWIELFKQCMADLLTTGEKTLLAEKAAEYYLRHKMHLEGIGIALKTGQTALISRALSQCGTSLMEQEQFELLGSCARILEKGGEELDASIYGILAQYYYVTGDYSRMEHNFNMADSMFGKENDYSIQRTLYRGLLKYEKDPQTYRKHVNNALFYLDELNLKLPFLLPREKSVLDEIMGMNSADEEAQDNKPLKVKQFGGFKVIITEDGREIPWRTKKGSELFAYLISLNEQAVERRQLFDVIWNEELPNNPVAMLHNMIYNIRKELSAYKLENVVQYKNKKYNIDMSLIESDLDAVSLVCSAIARKDMDMLLENETIIADYWGVYLENIDSLWASERRDYYDKMFVNGSLMLADFYYDNRIYEKALAYLQNALKIDIFSERIMEKTLNCYSKMGKFDKLRAKYEGYCEMLARELDIQPSPDLQSAYQKSIQRKV